MFTGSTDGSFDNESLPNSGGFEIRVEPTGKWTPRDVTYVPYRRPIVPVTVET